MCMYETMCMGETLCVPVCVRLCVRLFIFLLFMSDYVWTATVFVSVCGQTMAVCGQFHDHFVFHGQFLAEANWHLNCTHNWPKQTVCMAEAETEIPGRSKQGAELYTWNQLKQTASRSKQFQINTVETHLVASRSKQYFSKWTAEPTVFFSKQFQKITVSAEANSLNWIKMAEADTQLRWSAEKYKKNSVETHLVACLFTWKRTHS